MLRLVAPRAIRGAVRLERGADRVTQGTSTAPSASAVTTRPSASATVGARPSITAAGWGRPRDAVRGSLSMFLRRMVRRALLAVLMCSPGFALA